MRKLEVKRVNKTLLVSGDLHKRLEEERSKLGFRNFTQLLNYLLEKNK